MKVLIYSATCFSDNTLPLYKAMKKKGVDVTLLYEMSTPNENLFNEKEMIPRIGIFKAVEYLSFKRYEKYCDLNDVYVENIPGIRQRSIKMLKSTSLVNKFIKEGRFDVIHTDIPILMWKIPLLRYRKKIVLVQHEAIPHARDLRLYEKFFRWLNYRLIPKIVILNKTVYDQFCIKYNLSQDRVLVNKLGPLDCIKVFADREGIYNSKTLVFWGRISKYKGLEYLCQAMLLVHKEVPDAHLVIAGGGNLYFDIEPYKKLDYIEIINQYLDMEDLARIIDNCAFTICPYVSSSQSGGVITSLVMGKPVIGTDFKTMHEMIDDGVTGILVPPKNPKALAKAIIRLLDVDLQQKFMNNVKEKVNPDKEWAIIVDKYIEFYKKVL